MSSLIFRRSFVVVSLKICLLSPVEAQMSLVEVDKLGCFYFQIDFIDGLWVHCVFENVCEQFNLSEKFCCCFIKDLFTEPR